MSPISASLTDYVMAAECAVFTCVFARSPGEDRFLSRALALLFTSTGAAAAAGGLTHGPLADEGTLAYRIAWTLVLAAVGVAAVSGAMVGAALQFGPAAGAKVGRWASLVFAPYLFVVVFVRSEFLVAVLAYLPSLVFVGVAFIAASRRRGEPPLLLGAAGVGVMLVAAALQQAKVGLDPRLFDHNALYHTVQSAGLLLVFVAGRACMQPRPRQAPPLVEP